MVFVCTFIMCICVCVCVCVCVCTHTHTTLGLCYVVFVFINDVYVCVRAHTHTHTHTILQFSCRLDIDGKSGCCCNLNWNCDNYSTHCHLCAMEEVAKYIHRPIIANC